MAFEFHLFMCFVVLYGFVSSKSVIEQPDLVVAQDGSGNFTTVQEAVNSASERPKPMTRFTIYVKAGIYTENVIIPYTLNYITMYGDGISNTIITGSRHSGEGYKDLKETATFQAYGDGFIAQDMTFRNTAGPEAGQALAFYSGSAQSVFYRCSFEGYQDTLWAASPRQFYKECQIFGTVDFIFGQAAAVFQDCGIFLRKPRIGGGLVVTAHSRNSINDTIGFCFQGCNVTASDDLKPVLGQNHKAFLGRPWFPYALVVYIENYLDDVVDPQGWLDSTTGYNETCYFGEYNNYGPGSSTTKRVKWLGFHNITDQETAEGFTVARFISGNDWLPETGVPYYPGFKNN